MVKQDGPEYSYLHELTNMPSKYMSSEHRNPCLFVFFSQPRLTGAHLVRWGFITLLWRLGSTDVKMILSIIVLGFDKFQAWLNGISSMSDNTCIVRRDDTGSQNRPRVNSLDRLMNGESFLSVNKWQQLPLDFYGGWHETFRLDDRWELHLDSTYIQQTPVLSLKKW